MKYICCSHTGALGGAELALAELVQCLSNAGQVILTIPNRGLFLDYIQHKGVPDVVIRDWALWMQQDFTIKRRLKCLIKLWKGFRECLSFFRTEQPNIVIVNTISSPLPLLAAKWLHIPSVVFIHEVGGFGVYRFLFGETITRRLIGKWATHIVCNSKYTFKQYQRYILEQRMSVIYQPINIQPIAKLPHKHYTIGCVGVLSPQKNYEFLLHAISSLPDDVHCRIAGFCGNEYGDSMKQLCEQLGIANRVEWLGVVRDMSAFYASIDVLVACGKQEALGRSIIEAMKCQTVVIASNEGGYRELVSDNETGFIYAADDETDFLRVATKVRYFPAETLSQIQTNAEKFAQNTFSKDNFCTSFMQVVRNIIQ